MKWFLLIVLLLAAHPVVAQSSPVPAAEGPVLDDEAAAEDEGDDEAEDQGEGEDDEGVGRETAPAQEGGANKSATKKKPGLVTAPTAAGEKKAEADPIGQCVRKSIRVDEKGVKTVKVLSAVDLELARERRELEKAIRRYVAAAKDFRLEVRSVLSGAIEQRRQILNERYGRILGQATKTEEAARDAAIKKFKAFIRKYPKDKKFTPDAMYRLAELYYEKSELDYMASDDDFTRQMSLYDRGKLAKEPREPRKSYQSSERVWRNLLRRFPDYRYADAVYYLLGYVLLAEGKTDEVTKVWMKLIDKYPQSRSTPEVILRIGEILFDNGEFDKAEAIYKKALVYTKSRDYDKAVYKLAWTYMQQDKYDPAIKMFIKLIDFYEQKKGENVVGGALRDEAIAYLGSSLADDDWDGDGAVDEVRGLPRALAYLQTNKPYELEILEEYANTLYKEHDNDHYAQALAVYKLLLDRSPTSPKALDYQLQIIRTHDGLGDIEKRTSSRADLARLFHRGSEWYSANRDHPEVVERAEHQVAIHQQKYPQIYHQQAIALKLQANRDNDPELLAKARGFYALAATGYSDFLKRFPGSKLAEQMRMFQAEAFYYSGQLLAAAEAFQSVARDPKTKKFRDRAGHSAMVTFEKVIEIQVKAGLLDGRADPRGKFDPPQQSPEAVKAAGTEKIVVEQIPMPDLVKKWVAAVDFFVDNDLLHQGKREKQMEAAYLAGVMSFRYLDLDGARMRFRKVLACYPKSEYAANSATSIIDTYQHQNDYDNVEKWANLIESRQLGDAASIAAIRKSLKLFKLGVRARRASLFFEAKEYLKAAKEFERLAEEQPDDPDADKFYFNAARSYQKLKFYDSASGIFEKLVTDPRYKDSTFAEESLLSLAENYRLFFYYDKAIDAYMAHFNRYAKSDDRAYVLGRAAKLQLDNGDQRDAAQTYEQYARTFSDTPEAPEALYQAGLRYESLKDIPEQRRVWELFISRHRSTEGQDTKVLTAILKLGKIAQERGRVTKARKYFNDVLAQYNVRNQEPGTPSAAVAAEVAFIQTEPDFTRYKRIELAGSVRKQKSAIDRMKKMIQALGKRYRAIWDYKAYSWTICAMMREGNLFKQFQSTLESAPEPQGLSDDAMGMYLDQRDAILASVENKAILRYARAVEQSRELKVTHRCARQALVAMNGYRPIEYPLFKKEKQRFEYAPILPLTSAKSGGAP